jgi:hypothetical protein
MRRRAPNRTYCLVLVRSETYQYYNLPFCVPKDGKEYILEDLGEVLEGDRLVNTPYDIRFQEDIENRILCKRELNEKDLDRFRRAIQNDYYFQVRLQAVCDACMQSWQGSPCGILELPLSRLQQDWVVKAGEL